MQREWLGLVLEADGLSDYRDTAQHHHRVDWFSRVMSLVSLALVGFFIVSAAIEVAAARPSVTAEQDQLRERVLQEQRRTAAVEESYNDARTRLRDTERLVRPDINGEIAAALDAQSMAAAYVAVRGPGVVVSLDDARRPTFSGTTNLGRVIDRDIQHVVNALWQAGAEAIAIDGIRLTARTPIRNAGNAILVDYRPVRLPVVIRAIGDASRLKTRFKTLPEWEELVQLRDRYRIRWSFAASRSLRLPAGASLLPTTAQTEGAP